MLLALALNPPMPIRIASHAILFQPPLVVEAAQPDLLNLQRLELVFCASNRPELRELLFVLCLIAQETPTIVRMRNSLLYALCRALVQSLCHHHHHQK